VDLHGIVLALRAAGLRVAGAAFAAPHPTAARATFHRSGAGWVRLDWEGEPDEAAAAAVLASPRGEARFVSCADLARAAVALAGKLPPDAAGIAGVPRSGMAPAAVIATLLQLPLWEAGDVLRRVGHGGRGGQVGFARDRGRLVVVDDTVYSGASMERACRAAGGGVVRAAVFCKPESAGAVDVFAEPLPSPHLLEWNLFNSAVLRGQATDPFFAGGVAADLDGVLLHDERSGGPPGTPYMLPRTLPAPLIVTGRPESVRAETEAQLRHWGCRWERLEMAPPGADPARHKAAHYAASRCGVFVESDPEQAQEIFERCGKPVVCPRTGRVWSERSEP